MGRPATYGEDTKEAILEGLRKGYSLNAICAQEGFPDESTVREWAEFDPVFSPKYASARNRGLDARADRIKAEIYAEPDVQRARLVFDAERWYLSKMAPKRYGDKLDVGMEHSVSDDAKEFWKKLRSGE